MDEFFARNFTTQFGTSRQWWAYNPLTRVPECVLHSKAKNDGRQIFCFLDRFSDGATASIPLGQATATELLDKDTICDNSYLFAGSLCAVTREDDEPDSVIRLIDYLLTDEGQKLVERGGFVPVVK